LNSILLQQQKLAKPEEEEEEFISAIKSPFALASFSAAMQNLALIRIWGAVLASAPTLGLRTNETRFPYKLFSLLRIDKRRHWRLSGKQVISGS
jgi:hypothetical protein